MILVTSASLLVAVLSQVLITRDASGRLPAEVRLRIDELRAEGSPHLLLLRGRPLSQRASDDATSLTVADSIRAIDRLQAAQWRGLLYGLGLAVLASGGLAWVAARTIARPIAAVGAAASQVAAGDLDTRVPRPRSTIGAATEVVELTEGFNRMAATLERNEHERKAMVADVAHELRTPITALALRLDALRDGLVPFDAAEVERLSRQTALLHRLVEDLRTLSLADAGRLTLRRDDVEVASLLRDVSEAYAPLAAATDVRVTVRAGSPSELHVLGDADRLAQVLTNLLDNAGRASPPHSTIALEAASDEADVIIDVLDEGPGFSSGDLPFVFERFRQGASGRRDLNGHGGLGLAIVRTLVELHGGRVEAANRPEGGARVTIRLPRS